jgi:hypothetical protein
MVLYMSRNIQLEIQLILLINWELCVTVKWSRYRPGVAQRVGRYIALLFHDRFIRRGWVVRSTPRPHFAPGKDTVPILQEAGWAPGPVWTGGKSRPHRDSIADRPARSQSLYRLSYRARTYRSVRIFISKIERNFNVQIATEILEFRTLFNNFCMLSCCRI